ncbi:MAG: hypothetical protein HZA90_22130 [Verrucomicrobia bacterium]|nr:hypothetical protein [Verrucomicrobiota bacterium]
MNPTPAIPGSQRPRLLIVDGHAFAYRSFHAITSLNAPDGAPTNALFGFIKAIARMRETVQPEFVAVVWDGGLAEERLAALPGYKAQRPPMPKDLEVQLDSINAWLDAVGLAWFCRNGVEADDWIAVLARRAAGQGTEVVIASSDKDFMQLVSPQIGLLNPNDKSTRALIPNRPLTPSLSHPMGEGDRRPMGEGKRGPGADSLSLRKGEGRGEGTLWREEQVRQKTGVGPEQIVDWLSLIGDNVDNIPGVPGVGPKTATGLLNQFGSVEALYRRLAEVKSERLRGALQAAESDVRRNQSLIRLRDDLPLEFDLEKLRPRQGEPDRLKELYGRWGFKGMLARLEGAPPKQGELL